MVFQTYYPPSSRRWDLLKYTFSVQVTWRSTAPSDVIYSNTSLVSSSSTVQCRHSVPPVSKEQWDIKHNYNGFSLCEWCPCSWIRVQLGISHKITQLYRSALYHALQKTKTTQEISSRCLCLVQKEPAGKKGCRNVGIKHKESKGTGSLLQTAMTATLSSEPRNKKLVRCCCLSLCCCSQRAHPSQTWMEGQTDSV